MFGASLLVVAAFVAIDAVIAFLPMMECPYCHGISGKDFDRYQQEGIRMDSYPSELCGACFHGRVSVVKAWRMRNVLRRGFEKYP